MIAYNLNTITNHNEIIRYEENMNANPLKMTPGHHKIAPDHYKIIFNRLKMDSRMKNLIIYTRSVTCSQPFILC